MQERKKTKKKSVLTTANYACNRYLRWCTQAAWTKLSLAQLSPCLSSFQIDSLIVLLDYEEIILSEANQQKNHLLHLPFNKICLLVFYSIEQFQALYERMNIAVLHFPFYIQTHKLIMTQLLNFP